MKINKESKARTAIKSALYILIHETLLFLIAWIVTGNPTQSLAIMAIASIAELVYYYFYERMWSRVVLYVDKKKASR